MFTLVKAKSEDGRQIEMAVAVGQQEEFATELNLLGKIDASGQQYTVAGTTWVREGRDTPEVTLRRLDTGETLMDEAALDILFAVFVVLDEQPDGIIAQEMDRICG